MTNEEMVLMIQQGNRELLEALYLQNSGMIEKIISRYSGLEDLDDLRQEAYFGIVKAAELWSPESGALFMSYAGYWIRSVVRRYIDNCGAVVRVPVHRRAMLAKYRKTLNNYRMKFGQDPSERELCALLELTLEQLKDMKKDAAAVQIRSTSEVIGGDDDDITLEDTLADPSEPYEDVVDRLQNEELRREIWSCVEDLGEQRAAVIRGRFRDDMTREAIGDGLGLSKERIRQLEGDALRRLRMGDNLRRLRPYLVDESAYSYGLKNTGLGAFRRNGSSQEWAVMELERLAGMKLYGKELIT